MSRRETMLESRWRVSLRRGGLVTHESYFESVNSAEHYYDALSLPGEKRLEVRRAGHARFKLLRSEQPPEEPCPSCGSTLGFESERGTGDWPRCRGCGTS